MKGKYLGMDWKIVNEDTVYGLFTSIEIQVRNGTHLFRHGTIQIAKDNDDIGEYWDNLIGTEHAKLIAWMERTFRKYEDRNTIKQFFIRAFGHKYSEEEGLIHEMITDNEEIRFLGKWYI